MADEENHDATRASGLRSQLTYFLPLLKTFFLHAKKAKLNMKLWDTKYKKYLSLLLKIDFFSFIKGRRL